MNSMIDTLQRTATTPTGDKQHYSLIAGLQPHNAVRRLLFILHDQQMILEAYHDISRITCSEDGQALTLHCSHGSGILCIGDDLQLLMPYLQNEALPRIYCYDPAYHYIAQNSGKDGLPVVYEIKQVG